MATAEKSEINAPITQEQIESARSAIDAEEKRHHVAESNFFSKLKSRGHQEVEPDNSILVLENISFWYPGAEEPTLSNISFALPRGEIMAIRGDSGSGKTTILRLIAGLETPQYGRVIIDGKTVAGDKWVPPEKRHVGLVFQDYALFPHLNVQKNITFGLPHSENGDRLTQLVSLVGLEGLEKRMPHELSGGQQQRVALARTMASEPKLLLLDEPFSNLDENRRKAVRTEVKNIIRGTGLSVVLVTHDLHDVSEMADRAIEIERGKIIKPSSPQPAGTLLSSQS